MIKIGKIKIGQNETPKLISEISGNHGGSLSNAIKLIKRAAKNGTDLIKLQTYDPNNLTLNSSRPEFVIKDKKNLWRKKKIIQSLFKRTDLKRVALQNISGGKKK